MTKFPISVMGKYYNVTWPEFSRVQAVTSKTKLLDILFGNIKCTSAGLMIYLYNEDFDVLWVDDDLYFQDKTGSYSDYIEDMYSIKGVSFKNIDDAKKFQVELEKLYIWKTLKTS